MAGLSNKAGSAIPRTVVPCGVAGPQQLRLYCAPAEGVALSDSRSHERLLQRVLLADRPPFRDCRLDVGAERPSLPRPARIDERVVGGIQLRRQVGIAQLDGQLLDIQTEMRKREGQLVHAAEQTAEQHPI